VASSSRRAHLFSLGYVHRSLAQTNYNDILANGTKTFYNTGIGAGQPGLGDRSAWDPDYGLAQPVNIIPYAKVPLKF
jgi:hypothetical protein